VQPPRDAIFRKTQSIPIAIIEPQRLFAPFLTQLLSDSGFNVVVTLDALSSDEIARYDPRVIFVDVDFIEAEPVAAIRQLRSCLPNATICAYTERTDPAWAATCSRAGANCILSKSATPEELVAGIQRALHVGVFVDPRFDDEEIDHMLNTGDGF
jgi:DNA-binding NarL/FixJ family response regulator